MRIIIEVEGASQLPQIAVAQPSVSTNFPGVTQPSAGDATNAGGAPAIGGDLITTGANLNAAVAAPIVAQPGDISAGAAPNISAA